MKQLYLKEVTCQEYLYKQNKHYKIYVNIKKSKNKSENQLRGSTSCAASLRRAAHRMTGLGQSLRDPQSLMIGGKP